jgi:hypothetical protein
VRQLAQRLFGAQHGERLPATVPDFLEAVVPNAREVALHS